MMAVVCGVMARFDLAGIKVERVGVDVDEHGFDAVQSNEWVVATNE